MLSRIEWNEMTGVSGRRSPRNLCGDPHWRLSWPDRWGMGHPLLTYAYPASTGGIVEIACPVDGGQGCRGDDIEPVAGMWEDGEEG